VIAGADERAVPEASLETPRLADEESELHRCLAGRFPSLRGIRRAAFGGQTSFRLEVLTLELGAAGEVKLLLKDFGASWLPRTTSPPGGTGSSASTGTSSPGAGWGRRNTTAPSGTRPAGASGSSSSSWMGSSSAASGSRTG
jgi:hypothetical protein